MVSAPTVAFRGQAKIIRPVCAHSYRSQLWEADVQERGVQGLAAARLGVPCNAGLGIALASEDLYARLLKDRPHDRRLYGFKQLSRKRRQCVQFKVVGIIDGF